MLVSVVVLKVTEHNIVSIVNIYIQSRMEDTTLTFPQLENTLKKIMEAVKRKTDTHPSGRNKLATLPSRLSSIESVNEWGAKHKSVKNCTI